MVNVNAIYELMKIIFQFNRFHCSFFKYTILKLKGNFSNSQLN